MSKTKTTKLDFKRGDDFKLDFTITNTNTNAAVSLNTTLLQEKIILAELQAADPVDPVAVAAQEAVVIAADIAYETEILMDITGWTITSQIRWHNELVNDFIIDDSNFNIGKFTLELDKEFTIDWRVAEHEVDIQFGRLTGSISSQTFIVNVQKDVTRV